MFTGYVTPAFDEDRHQLRTGAGPQVMATLRNLAISLIRTLYDDPTTTTTTSSVASANRGRLSQPGHDPETRQSHQTPNNHLTTHRLCRVPEQWPG